MKKILLIDADSKIPNLALMKISTFYKAEGYRVELRQLGLSYYPNKKNKVHYIETAGYERAFCSAIFDNTLYYVQGDNIEYGGTGYSLRLNLPEEIADREPDYSLYPDNDTSYGFLSRGCIRNCSFCDVYEKEGRIRQVAGIDDIVRHKKVKFLDNNFLALDNHKELLAELHGLL